MIKLDSVKLKAPLGVLTSIKTDAFLRSTSKPLNSDNILRDVSEAKEITHGLNRISINNLSNEFSIEVSAKLLGNNYYSGISLNTFEELISNVNKTGIVEINADAFYNTADILRADITDNIKLDYKGNIYSDLSLIPLPNKCDATLYNTKTNKGIAFKGKQTSFKERQIFYSKSVELVNKPSGRKFLNAFNSHKILNDFKGAIRVEGNFTSFAKIRQYTATDNKLSSVLNSDAKVNYTLFKKITNTADNGILFLFSKYEGMKISEVIRRRGIEGILRDAKFNWNYVDAWLKNKAVNNHRRYRKEFKRILLEIQKTENRINDNHVIEIVANALKLVA